MPSTESSAAGRLNPLTKTTGELQMNRPRRHGGAVKKMMSRKDDFDIETWHPSKLTYRGGFFTQVCILNIISNGLGFLILLFMYLDGRTSSHAGFNVFIGLLVYAGSVVALVYLWKLYKWAAILYISLSAFSFFVAILLSHSNLIALMFQGILHIGTVGMAVYSRWMPKYIPAHIKNKYGLE